MDTPITIDPNLCTGCGRCVKACPRDVLELVKTPDAPSGSKALAVVVRPDACTECGSCAAACKTGAVSLAAAGPFKSGPFRPREESRPFTPLFPPRRGGRSRGGRGRGNRHGGGPRRGR